MTNMIILFTLQKMQSRELTKIMGELNVDGGDDDEDDLLDLMDSAN